MGQLTAEQLGQAIKLAEDDVDLPELGGTVRIRALTVGQRQRMRKGIMDTAGNITDQSKLEMRMFVLGVCNPRLTHDQAAVLKDQWSTDMWDRVIVAITKLGADDAEVEAAIEAEFQDADD